MRSVNRRPARARTTGRRLLATLCSLVLAMSGAFVLTANVTGADGPATFSNSAAIAVPATGSSNQIGPASPYPSPITVSGMSGNVSKVTLTLHGVSHGAVNDIDAMLVAPSGENLVVLSDVGDPGPQNPDAQLVMANNIDLTFDDAATTSVPRVLNLPSGTYKPTNTNSGDTFPAPAPTPSSQTTFAGAFTGIGPNGAWNLYVVDDATGEVGTIAGGWSLSITTETAAVPTVTTATTSDATSATGDPVTFTATVTAGGSPVTAGTVQFSDGGNSLGAPVALDGSGTASLTTASLTEGTHTIGATYSGATGFLTSNGSFTQRVDNQTVVSGNTFCNAGPISVPSVGSAQPYPSNITVSGVSGTVTKVTATLKGLSHTAPGDFDILLSGPTPSTNVLLLSDSGGLNPVSNMDVTFDDDAAGTVPTPLVSGTFKPTNSDDGSSDAFPAPAPSPSAATTLSTFDGSNPNGQWSLWVLDDASGDAGSISGGWCVTITTTNPTVTTLTSTPNPSTVGETVDFTATVTSGGNPVTSGTVQFTDGGNAMGFPAVLNASGTAVVTTSSLAEGSHDIAATYDGTGGFLTSSGHVTQVVDKAAQSPLAVTSTTGISGVPLELTTSGGSGTGAVTYAAAAGTASGCAVSATTPYTLTASSAGTCVVTATKAGDGTYNAISSPPTTVTITAAPAPTGMLRVTTSPPVPSKITVDGRTADTWGLNWVKVASGTHDVCFGDVAGYSTPDCQTVTVATDATTTVAGVFQLNGYLKVETSPAVASQITIDGNLANNWGVFTDVVPGQHHVCFGAVAGYDAPTCQDVTVTAGDTATITGQFTLNAAATGQTGLGLLQVTTSPAVPSKISIDGQPGDTWGLNWLEISPGTHKVCYSDVAGYTTPDCETITVTAGETTTVTGVFQQNGYLEVEIAPVPGLPPTISIDGAPADDWGVHTDLLPGTYQVCFGDVPGYTAPACQDVTIIAGETVAITGSYT